MSLEIYDTTLRDGAQGVGINFSVSDKMRIADHLDRLGVDVIEGGWPGANQTDTEFFAAMRHVSLDNARLSAFGATRRPGVRPQDDLQLRALHDSGAPIITLVGKTWDAQVRDVLRTTAEENLLMIEESVRWLHEQGREVYFDAEHFFDGATADADYAVRCLEAAVRAGAARIALCDTNGGTLPDALEERVGAVTSAFGAIVGIHCHDDTGCAVANTLAAVRAGAVQVQGCINGYGERTGNANLCTLIPALQLKMGHAVVSDDQLRELTATARDVAEIANLHPPVGAPYVGAAAFTHKGGQHVDAMRKAAYAYQHIDPAAVGNRTRSVVSAQSGGGQHPRPCRRARPRPQLGPRPGPRDHRTCQGARTPGLCVRGGGRLPRVAHRPGPRPPRALRAGRVHRARGAARWRHAGVRGDRQAACRD